jgi:hypothetical protein
MVCDRVHELPGHTPPPPMPVIAADRIRLADAFVHLKPLMSRATFYGSQSNPGPRWTMIAQLDIREGPPINMDRRRFNAWLRRLQGGPATDRQPVSKRLNGEPASTCGGAYQSYGDQVAVLCRALEAGRISESVFERAMRDVEGGAGSATE